ncbi:DUF418 domain-containing protein [Streptomyces sp. NPDC005500]|uniref:DUF418 domain-containing protein n=1 Tax=Streptomyces sp. NPDC005500 TaxID=3155007 RepID=UPI0033B2F610
MTRSTVKPVALAAEPQRVAEIDTLRGFALFGIVVVNSIYIGSTFRATTLADPAADGPLQLFVSHVVTGLFETKFFLLFSFLFGYSFTLQLDSADRRGRPFAGAFTRRLLGLALIGVAHAVLLYTGDILTTYAVLGLVLLACSRMRPRSALLVASALVAVVALFFAALALAVAFDPEAVSTAAETSRALQAAEAYRAGPARVIAQHLAELPALLISTWGYQAPCALAAFLVGLAAGKHHLLSDIAAHKSSLRKLIFIGLLIGLPGAVFFAWSRSHPGTTVEAIGFAVDAVTAPSLAAAYASLVLLATTYRRTATASALLAPAGRTALSNYIAQSLLLALVFTGYGAGLINRFGPVETLVTATAIYLLLATASTWWTARYHYGPLEWLLRAATHLMTPAWRRTNSPTAQPSSTPGA